VIVGSCRGHAPQSAQDMTVVPYFSLFDCHNEDSLVVTPWIYGTIQTQGVRLHMSRIRPEYLAPDSSDRSIGADVRVREEPDDDEEDDEDENDHPDEDEDEEKDDGYSE
jgi:hypothetical protein